MRQMKYSGIEWIGKIPETWEVLQIRRIMRNRSERNQPNAVVLSLYRDWGIVPKDSRDDNHNVTSEDTSSYKVVSKGNFVINKMKAWQGSMAVSDYDGIISPAYYVCSFTKEVCKKYVHYLLRDASYKPEYMRLSTGMRIGQWDLNIDDFLRIKAIIPPLADQQHIADYLDSKCGEIDSLIALQEQMIEKLKAYKQSVITEAVTKGLDPNAKLVPSGIDWIGDIPEGWSKDKVVRCFKKIGSGTTPKSTDDNQFQGDINWLQSGDINGSDLFEASKHISEQTLASYSALSVYQAPFIIIAMYGASVGNISISHIDACVNQACCVLNFSNLNFKFAFYALKSAKPYLIYRAEGGGQPNISQDKLKSLWIPRPPMDVQPSIASYLDSKCSDIDRLIALKQQKIESLKDYKKSVIYEAVTGKIEI